jgi:ribosomal protein S18 acetylase RimI-like enzyme
VYVAKHNKKIIGALIAYQTKDDEIYVCDWVIDKEYRGKKIGQKLYEHLINDVEEKAIVSFIDPENTPSLDAHLKLGFKIVKKIKNPYVLNEGYKIFVRRNPNNLQK